jgi:hypothetical protein
VTEVPTDLWFRTELELTELATGLGAVLRTSDAEDWWAWVIADLDEGVRLDITRPHGVPPADFDTRVFRLGPDRTLPPPLVDRLAAGLAALGVRTVWVGSLTVVRRDYWRTVDRRIDLG